MKEIRKIYAILTLIFACQSLSTAQWVKMDSLSGLTSDNIVTTVDFENYIFAGTSGQGIFRSTNNGDSWITANTGLTNGFVYSFLVSGTKIFAGTNEGLFISSNKGEDWYSDSTSLTTQWVYRLAKLDNFLFAGTLGGGVFRSSDEGNQWIEVNNGLGLSSVYCLHATSTHLFAGPGQIYPGGTYSTQNFGEQWQLTGLVPGYLVYDIDHIDNRLFAGLFSGSVMISDDNGITWSYSGSGITNNNIRCLTVKSDHIFAGAGGIVIPGMPVGGVFHSSNSGSSWLPITYDLPDKTVITLEVHNEYLYAGLHQNGLWKRSLSGIVSSSEILSPPPQNFELYQNFPNPFNPVTTIKFSIANSGVVSLKVYDILGREVATLLNEEKPSGNYEVEFNANEISSGIYFYKLQSGNFIETKKMILMK